MYSIWFSLLWKEWREHRLIIAVLGALAVLVPLAFIVRHPSSVIATTSFCLFTIPAFSMFLGMNIAGREQSTGTIRFLQALPITGRPPAAAKLLWAFLSIVVPVLLMVGTAALWIQLVDGQAIDDAVTNSIGTERTLSDWYFFGILSPILASASLLIWMAAGGVNRSDEVRAGAIGFLIGAGYWLVLIFFGYLADVDGHRPAVPEEVVRMAIATAPGGIAPASRPASSMAEFWSRNWFVLAAAIVTHGALAAWFIGRVVPGRPQPLEREAVSTTTASAWLAPPRRRPLTAMLWKQFRESAPLPLLAAGCIIAISLIVGWVVPRYHGSVSAVDVLQVAAALWMMVGFMVATVAGVGVFMEDLQPGLHTFWRSRPIKVDQWFVVKFVVGLLSTIVTLAIPLLLVAAYTALATDRVELSRLTESGESRQMIVMGLLIQVSFYTAAVAAMVVMRQPIYAVVMAIAGVGLAAAAGGWLLETLDRAFMWDDRPTVIAAIALFLLAILAAIGIAWDALRKDWGWKR